MHLMPRTFPGKWSVRLAVAFILLFVAFHFIPFGAGGPSWLFNASVLGAASCAIVAFVMGLIAVFHRGETAVLVFVSMAVGFAVTLFVAAEFMFPH